MLGTVWNSGTDTAYRVQALVTLFDGQDRVLGYTSVFVGTGSLAPGSSARFDARVPQLGVEPSRYLVTILGSSRP